MNTKHQNTLKTVLSIPTPKNVLWSDVEALFIAIGCKVVEGRGSRVRFLHVEKGIWATFHRPHPAKEAKSYQVKAAKNFLELLEIQP